MRKYLVIMLVLACLGSLFGAQIFVVNSDSRTLSRIDTASSAVNNSFAQLGLTPNRMLIQNDEIYVVCSGANSIQVFSRISGAMLDDIFIAGSSNPWDLAGEGDHLYVTGYFTNKVYKVHRASSSVVASVNVGVSPEGMAIVGGKLYVGNTGGYASGYANSSVSVIDLNSFSVIKTIPVWTNPQDLQAYGNEIHVACTGNWASISGAIDIIDTTIDEQTDRILTGGNPWSLWINPSGIAFIGEGYNSGVYSYNAVSHTLLHGYDNPLNPGAVAVHGSANATALLSANWGANGTVYLQDGAWNTKGQYTVGLLPTDLWLWEPGSAAEDELQPQSTLQIYPNPLSRNGILQVQSDGKTAGDFYLYNLKGQKVLQQRLDKGSLSLPLQQLKLNPGLYFYRAGSKQSGKLIVY